MSTELNESFNQSYITGNTLWASISSGPVLSKGLIKLVMRHLVCTTSCSLVPRKTQMGRVLSLVFLGRCSCSILPSAALFSDIRCCRHLGDPKLQPALIKVGASVLFCRAHSKHLHCWCSLQCTHTHIPVSHTVVIVDTPSG